MKTFCIITCLLLLVLSQQVVYAQQPLAQQAFAVFEQHCTATGNSGHSLRQDCGIISIYLKGVSDGEAKTKKLHSRV